MLLPVPDFGIAQSLNGLWFRLDLGETGPLERVGYSCLSFATRCFQQQGLDGDDDADRHQRARRAY